VKQTQIY
jgi:calpain, invertebrate